MIELIITIAIIGILSAVAIPAYIGQQRNAARQEAYSTLQNLRLLEEQYFADRGCYYMEGATPACTSKTLNISEIRVFLPGFKPGGDSSLNFDYSLRTWGSTAASAFTATATGKPGSRVAGDSFTIDNNNNRNF